MAMAVNNVAWQWRQQAAASGIENLAKAAAGEAAEKICGGNISHQQSISISQNQRGVSGGNICNIKSWRQLKWRNVSSVAVIGGQQKWPA